MLFASIVSNSLVMICSCTGSMSMELASIYIVVLSTIFVFGMLDVSGEGNVVSVCCLLGIPVGLLGFKIVVILSGSS